MAIDQTDDNGVGAYEDDRDHRGSILAAISRSMVALYKEQFGRGPTRARTYFAGPDALVCLLEDTFTPAERTLVKLNEHQRLRDVRLFFQYASVDKFVSIIENQTGRRVRAFISGIDAKEDVSAELFVLEPELPPRD